MAPKASGLATAPISRHGGSAGAEPAGQRGLAAPRGPPTWRPVAASVPGPRPVPTAPWRPPWGRGGGGGSAGSVVAGSATSRRLVVTPLRVWRRRLSLARSSLRPATRTSTPDPGGGKRAAIQNQCSFIGSDGGHSHCPPAPHFPPKRARRMPGLPATRAACAPDGPRVYFRQAAARNPRAHERDLVRSRRVAMTLPEARMIESHGFRCRRWRTGERRARRAAGVPWCRTPEPEHRGFESLPLPGAAAGRAQQRCTRSLSASGLPGPELGGRGGALRAPCPGSGRDGR